jgi:hypothetical protein
MLSTVGSEELSAAGIRVYPNPAKEMLFVEINENSPMKEGTIQIFNSIGKSIYNRTLSANDQSISIDLKGFASGVYTFRLLQEGNKAVNYKVVVHK